MPPGWNDWYIHRNGDISRQLLDENDEVMLKHVHPLGAPNDGSTDRFFDKDGRRLNNSEVDRVRSSSQYTTPRYPSQGLEEFQNVSRQTSVPIASRHPNVELASSRLIRRSNPTTPSARPGNGNDNTTQTSPTPTLDVDDRHPNFDMASLRTKGKLPSWYKVQRGSWFEVGRVFRVWVPDQKGPSTANGRDNEIYGVIRPYVVVTPGPASAMCVYGNQGVSKEGLSNWERKHHAIIHAHDSQPELLEAEKPFRRLLLMPFKVTMTTDSTLLGTSRVRFDSPRTIQYNVKVRNIGLIEGEEQIQRLKDCYLRACSGSGQ